jgi:hypothetical protein
MPWTAHDAQRHTGKAASRAARRQWAEVANSILERTGDEGQAVREANAVIAKRSASEAEPMQFYVRRRKS